MQETSFDRNDFTFLIRLKAREFRKQNQKNITEKHIKEYLFNIKWKKKERLSTNQIVDDIMNLDVSEVFDYLSIKVIKDASQLSIQDFSEFISK